MSIILTKSQNFDASQNIQKKQHIQMSILQRQGETMRSAFLRSGLCVHHSRSKYISIVHLKQLCKIGVVSRFHQHNNQYSHIVKLSSVSFMDEMNMLNV